MDKNSFVELYKTLAADELLDIVDNPNDYQPMAVEVAQQELSNRGLSSEQIEVAKAIQVERQLEKVGRRHRIKLVEGKVALIGSSVAHAINPLHKENVTTGMRIQLVSIFFIGIFLYQLYKDSGLLIFMLSTEVRKWDLTVAMYLIEFLLPPVAGLLVWLRKKVGWILATIYSSYTAIGSIPLAIMEINREPIVGFEDFFPRTSFVVFVLTLLVFGGLTWVLCRKDFRKTFGVDNRTVGVALGAGAGLVLLLSLSFIFYRLIN